MRILALLPAWASWAVAWIPSSPGMRTSIKMTSGSSRRAWASAWLPSPASPATRRSGSASTSIRRPLRIRSWSSAIRTLIMTARRRRRVPGAVVGDLDGHRAVRADDRHLGAGRVRVLEHVGQRLLDDAVGRHVHTLRQRRVVTVDEQAD